MWGIIEISINIKEFFIFIYDVKRKIEFSIYYRKFVLDNYIYYLYIYMIWCKIIVYIVWLKIFNVWNLVIVCYFVYMFNLFSG